MNIKRMLSFVLVMVMLFTWFTATAVAAPNSNNKSKLAFLTTNTQTRASHPSESYFENINDLLSNIDNTTMPVILLDVISSLSQEQLKSILSKAGGFALVERNTNCDIGIEDFHFEARKDEYTNKPGYAVYAISNGDLIRTGAYITKCDPELLIEMANITIQMSIKNRNANLVAKRQKEGARRAFGMENDINAPLHIPAQKSTAYPHVYFYATPYDTDDSAIYASPSLNSAVVNRELLGEAMFYPGTKQTVTEDGLEIVFVKVKYWNYTYKKFEFGYAADRIHRNSTGATWYGTWNHTFSMNETIDIFNMTTFTQVQNLNGTTYYGIQLKMPAQIRDSSNQLLRTAPANTWVWSYTIPSVASNNCSYFSIDRWSPGYDISNGSIAYPDYTFCDGNFDTSYAADYNIPSVDIISSG